ncbi:MAG TPA: circadian clock protein KaiC [Methylomirabilota bacterium]|nr:circadian clock protein KaiC [Methylomirabilota bacterium]
MVQSGFETAMEEGLQKVTDSAPARTSEPSTSIPKTATRIQGLDSVLDGGLPTGRTTLVVGGPGTGKTVLALEFLVRGAADGEPGLFISFEERAEALAANAGTLGWDLPALEAEGVLTIVDAPPPWPAARSGDFDIQGLLAIIEGQVARLGARRIALDSVDQLMLAFEDPERERAQLHALHDWLLERDLTTVMTVKEGHDGEPIYPFLSFLADCVLRLDQRMAHQVRTRRLQVVKYRGSGFQSNEYPYLISRRGLVVMPVTEAGLDSAVTGARISSGDRALDEILGGGYRTGSTALVAGPTGVGKSTLACLFATAAAEDGEAVLYVSFEESGDALVEGMSSVGIELEPLLANGRLRQLNRLPESSGVEEHLFEIAEALDDSGARHLVVDAISACARMGSPKAAFDFLLRLITLAKARGVTCLCTTQTANGADLDEISGIGVSSLIDTVVQLGYEPQGTAMRRRLRVVKSRGSRHSNRFHWLELGDDGISLSAPAAETGELRGGRVAPRGSGG